VRTHAPPPTTHDGLPSHSASDAYALHREIHKELLHTQNALAIQLASVVWRDSQGVTHDPDAYERHWFWTHRNELRSHTSQRPITDTELHVRSTDDVTHCGCRAQSVDPGNCSHVL